VQIEHLAERGHRSVAFASTNDPRLSGLSAERVALARDSAERLGLTFSVRAIEESTAASAVTDWVERGVTAVAGYNDDIASLVLGAALRRGISVPGQLAIIGHDDTPLARRLVPSMSSIHVDAAGVGRYFAELALRSVEGGDAPVAPPAARATLVVRESS
jgi:DNA-binding LacI/PurR family transcriptional regulator